MDHFSVGSFVCCDKHGGNLESIREQAVSMFFDIVESFYDESSVEEVGDLKNIKIKKGLIKKINIGIPISMYEQAMRLSIKTGTGYQNILKLAMSIGVNELKDKIAPKN